MRIKKISCYLPQLNATSFIIINCFYLQKITWEKFKFWIVWQANIGLNEYNLFRQKKINMLTVQSRVQKYTLQCKFRRKLSMFPKKLSHKRKYQKFWLKSHLGMPKLAQTYRRQYIRILNEMMLPINHVLRFTHF